MGNNGCRLEKELTTWYEDGRKKALYKVDTPGGIRVCVRLSKNGKLFLTKNEYDMDAMDIYTGEAAKLDVAKEEVLECAKKYADMKMPLRGVDGKSIYRLADIQTFHLDESRGKVSRHTIFTFLAHGDTGDVMVDVIRSDEFLHMFHINASTDTDAFFSDGLLIMSTNGTMDGVNGKDLLAFAAEIEQEWERNFPDES